jgi:K+-transporting ATPase KdpF subunit
MTLMDVAAAVIVVALLAYLVYALLAPERLG